MTQLTNRGTGVFRIVAMGIVFGILADAARAQPSKQATARDDDQHEFGQATSNSVSSPWNQFRGPNGMGVAAGAKPPIEFDLKTNLRWASALPAGYSSPVIWKNRIFITGMLNKQFKTLCLDRTSGKILWRKTAPKVEVEKHHPANSPATSTPYVDAQRVYVYFGSFGLLCYDHDGHEVWRHPVSTPSNMHGTATSPVGYKHLLFLIHDSMDGNSYALAVNKSTGKDVWKARRPVRNPNWTSPVIWRKVGGDELIIMGGGLLKAYNPLTGEEIWSVGGFGQPIPIPVVGDKYLYASTISGTEVGMMNSVFRWKYYTKYDKNSDGRVHVSEIPKDASLTFDPDLPEEKYPTRMMIQWFDRDKDGAFTETELQQSMQERNLDVRSSIAAIRQETEEHPGEGRVVWKYERSIPQITSCLYADGKVYMLKCSGVVTCLDSHSGRLVYQARLGRGHYSASPVCANGNIYICSREGVISVFNIGEKPDILAKNDLGESIVATPAISDDTLYIRTASRLYAFSSASSH